MNYDEAVGYLYSFTNFEMSPAKRYDPALYDRFRLVELLEHLGNPHKRYASVHIAGSKGKGSTAALLAGMLQTAGYRTGLYTSPHLHTFCERIQVDRKPIPRAWVATLVGELQAVAGNIAGLTTFELITALGFLYFARAGVEIAVVEVGMGGRLDATNVLNPLVTVITPLSREHTMFLGDTLAQIAVEKAGIVKQEVPLVLAAQSPEADAVIAGICRRRAAPLFRVHGVWAPSVLRRSVEGSVFVLHPLSRDPRWEPFHSVAGQVGQIRLPLLGDHQIQNACLSLATIVLLDSRGFPVSPVAIRQGISTVDWPGRMEVLRSRPFVIADGAHNPASAGALVNGLRAYLGPRPIRLVYGSLEDKDARGVLRILLPAAEEVIVVAPHYPRAMPVERIVEIAHELGRTAVVASSVSEGVKIALGRSKPEDLVCVTGSLFVVGECRDALLPKVRAST